MSNYVLEKRLSGLLFLCFGDVLHITISLFYQPQTMNETQMFVDLIPLWYLIGADYAQLVQIKVLHPACCVS